MATITAVTVAGNLTRDPEIRYTREGQATTSLSVAVNRRWQNQQTKEWEESVSFLDVVCWRDLAENVALSLTKGSQGARLRSPGAAELGDRWRGAPVQGRNRGRRRRRLPPVRHHRRAPGPPPRGRRRPERRGHPGLSAW